MRGDVTAGESSLQFGHGLLSSVALAARRADHMAFDWTRAVDLDLVRHFKLVVQVVEYCRHLVKLPVAATTHSTPPADPRPRHL